MTQSLSRTRVFTSIEEDAPAQDDATYSVNLENAGEPHLPWQNSYSISII